MRFSFKTSVILLFLFALSFPRAVSAHEAGILPDGSLIKGEGQARIYFLENGLKRWIDSPATILSQGLSRQSVITLPVAELEHYGDGEMLRSTSQIILPGEADLLPDLVPFSMYDVKLQTVGAEKRLKFSSTLWNKGAGKFEIVASGKLAGSDDQHTYQRITKTDGSLRDKLVGEFIWHAPHNHFHYDNLATYGLELLSEDGGKTAAPIVQQKTTFCMRDMAAVDVSLPGAPQRSVFGACTKLYQGLSVGWADVYSSDLPDQYLNVTGLPAGTYVLSFTVDPNHQLLELDQTNNVSTVTLELDPEKNIVRVIDTSNPYKGSVSAVRARAIRPEGSPSIYLLNENGYRRRALNPAVLTSYGLTAADVTQVSVADFTSYPETDLIALQGTDTVYSLNEKRVVGKKSELAALGLQEKSVHTVTPVDFSAYSVSTVAKNLTVPWDIVFLPDGDMLVTERPGTLKRIGKTTANISLPSIRHVGEGGLMGIALHPDFAQNSFVYLYYTTIDNGNTNQISRFKLEGNALVDEKIILDHIAAAQYHDGGQIAFGPDGKLYVTTGDAEQPNLAQDLNSLNGKTLRLNDDGSIPSDNPFGTAVWSYGHRNAQGIAWDDEGRMWETEHGRSGALSGYDEINLIEKGKNYGWPTIEGSATKEGMVTPALHSGANDTWAPSGLVYADGKLYFAGLRGAALYEVTITGNGVTNLKAHVKNVYGRLRAVVSGPDGSLYVSTSNKDGRGTPKVEDDKILRFFRPFLR
jgi:glucose/arabinose dehydrogenase